MGNTTVPYGDKTNIPFHKSLNYRFAVDAGNAPTLAASPANIGVLSVVRVSQGLYRLTLVESFRSLISHRTTLNVTGAGVARWAQGSTVANLGTATPVTVDILVVDNAGAVQNPPAAAAENYISGELVFCDTAGV